MAAFTGRTKMGLYENGKAQSGTDYEFTGYNYTTADALSGDGCFAVDYNVYGSGLQSDLYIPVDTSKYYIHSVSMKTYQTSYNGRNGSGHIGFACFDKNKSFIDLRNCGDVGNTTLSRAASPGDSVIYFTSSSGWYTGADVTANRAYYRQILFFPATHPDYGQAHRYTRFNNRSYYRMEQTAQGDWAVYLDSRTGSQTNYGNTYASTLPDYGYSLPAGTPVSRGVAGGTYNYAHGAPVYPTTWTTYTTSPFTGENRNSGTPFRYGTKYIRYLNLRNYNYRSEQGGDSARYYIDNIMLIQLPEPNKDEVAAGRSYNTTYFNNSSKRQRAGKVDRFKKRRRGGQKRSDFF